MANPLPPGVRRETIDGKEYIVVKSHKPPAKFERDKAMEDMALVAYLYPQYTLKQIYEELPSYQLPILIRAARKEQAQQLLLLNAIIHGPNAKNKEPYKKLIKNLSKQAE